MLIAPSARRLRSTALTTAQPPPRAPARGRNAQQAAARKVLKANPPTSVRPPVGFKQVLSFSGASRASSSDKAAPLVARLSQGYNESSSSSSSDSEDLGAYAESSSDEG
jgi:hypothetical protein